MFNKQTYSSANTSINSKKLPAIYNHINFEKIKADYDCEHYIVFDWGCGRYTDHIQKFVASKGFGYWGYDPNWSVSASIEKEIANEVIANLGGYKNTCLIFICSNVLNVIDSKDEIDAIKNYCYISSRDYLAFFSVYEGNRSGKGKVTKADCYQRNEVVSDYCTKPWEKSKGNIFTHQDNLKYIKSNTSSTYVKYRIEGRTCFEKFKGAENPDLDQVLTFAARMYNSSYLTGENVLEITHKGKRYFYCGWEPDSRYSFKDESGKVVWSVRFPQWEM